MSVLRKILKSKHVVDLIRFSKTDPMVPKAIDFLREYYHPNDPLFQQFKEKNDEQVLIKLWERCIETDTSIAMIDSRNGQLLNVMLNNIHYKDQEFKVLVGTTKPSKAMKIFFDIEAKLWNEIDLFGKYPNYSKIFELSFGTTHPDWYNNGIFTTMIKYSENVIAKEQECSLIYSISTNKYTVKTLDRLGHQEIWRMNYDDILANNKLWTSVAPLHEGIICKIKEISP